MFTVQSQVFRGPVRRVPSPKPPCILAPSLSQPRQADQSIASKRGAGEKMAAHFHGVSKATRTCFVCLLVAVFECWW
jgi:hypothetical protein